MGGIPFASHRFERAWRDGGRPAVVPLQAARARRAGSIARVDWAVDGTDNLPDGPYVLVHNESSLLDLLVLHGLILTEYAELTMGAAAWNVIPGAERMAHRMGIRTFRRGDREQAGRLLDELADHVRGGGRVSMSGPGRFSPDGEVQRFKRGGALIAIRAGAPVVPTCIEGGAALLPPGSLRVRPGTVRLRFGAPISALGLSEDEAPDLAAQVRDVVARLYAEAKAERALLGGAA